MHATTLPWALTAILLGVVIGACASPIEGHSTFAPYPTSTGASTAAGGHGGQSPSTSGGTTATGGKGGEAPTGCPADFATNLNSWPQGACELGATCNTGDPNGPCACWCSGKSCWCNQGQWSCKAWDNWGPCDAGAEGG